MTYNFDPDRWYKNEFEFKKTQHKAGKITDQELKSALKELYPKETKTMDEILCEIGLSN